MNGPHWIKQWIADLAMLNDQFRNDDGSVDFDALGREEYMFRMALITRNFSKSERALVVFEKAQASYETNVERGKKGGRPRKDTTADAPTREDGEFKSDSGDAGNLESATSANLYGEAATSDGADVSTTFSDNFEARQSQARESQRRAGADSVRGTPLHSAPARPRAKNSRCPNSREEFHAFVADNNLHEGLAEEWYAIHEARGWVDENGNPIKNWRGAIKNFCIKVEQKRRTA